MRTRIVANERYGDGKRRATPRVSPKNPVTRTSCACGTCASATASSRSSAGLSFAIRRGECFALLGPNGAGKTTTLRCCLGLIDPDGGTIELVGEPVPKAAREARIRVGVVPQMDNLDPDFTVRENLLIYGGYFRHSAQHPRRAHPAPARIRGARRQGGDVAFARCRAA